MLLLLAGLSDLARLGIFKARQQVVDFPLEARQIRLELLGRDLAFCAGERTKSERSASTRPITEAGKRGRQT